MNDYKELIERLRDLKKATLDGWTINRLQVVMRMDCLDAADAIEQLVRERDAAIADLKVYEDCSMCKNYCGKRNKCTPFIDNKSGTCDFRCVICKDCDYKFEKWEWRGMQE